MHIKPLTLLVLLACGQSLYQQPQLTPCPYADPRKCIASSAVAPAYRSTGPFSPSFTAPFPLASNTTAFCVAANLSTSSDWTTLGTRYIFQLGTWPAANTISFYLSTYNQAFSPFEAFVQAEVYDPSDTRYLFNSLSALASYPSGWMLNSSHAVAMCYDSPNGYMFVDGVQTSTFALGSASTLPATMRLGARDSNPTFPYTTGLNWVCIDGPTGASTGSPASDIKNACGWNTNTVPALAPRYGCFGCVGASPNGNAKKVIALGDSITQYGSGVARPYPAKLNALLGVGYNVTNAGITGDTVSGMKTRYEATARNFDRCVFLGGINDIIAGTSAATVWTSASALLDEMRSDGCRPVIVLPTPWASYFSWTSAKQTQYDILRGDYSSYCSTNSLTCVETSTGLGDGNTPVALASQYDDGTHVHPSQTGTDELAQLVYAGVTWP